MKDKKAKELLNKVREDYNLFAEKFSARKKLWPEFYGFRSFVKGGDKILDLGCGSGRLVEIFTDIEVDYQGVDISQNLIAMARQKYPGYQYRVADMLALPFGKSEFDVAFSIASLHHIPSRQYRQKVLAECFRVLKRGGLLIILVRNLYQWKFIKYFFYYTIKKLLGENLDFKDVFIPWAQSLGMERYFHAFTKRELINLIRQQGFKIRDVYYAKDENRTNFLDGDNLIVVGQKRI